MTAFEGETPREELQDSFMTAFEGETPREELQEFLCSARVSRASKSSNE